MNTTGYILAALFLALLALAGLAWLAWLLWRGNDGSVYIAPPAGRNDCGLWLVTPAGPLYIYPDPHEKRPEFLARAQQIATALGGARFVNSGVGSVS